MINATDHVPRQSVRWAGHNFSIAVAGEGPPVVLLHGSATHAYSWRNVIPYLARRHRCMAPDLPGMGGTRMATPSGLAGPSFRERAYSIGELVRFLEPQRPVVMIGHELGAMIAVQYARDNPDSVAGLVLVEGSFRVSNDTKFDPDIRRFLADIRSEQGEDMILHRNMLVESYLGRLTSRHLGPEEMHAYRNPYRRPGKSRQAMLDMIRELPLRSHPGPIDELAEQSRVWCSRSTIPKLVVGANPGFLVPPYILATTARWANTMTAVVRGLHFLMEDSPARLTSIILDWLVDVGHTRPSTAADSPNGTDDLGTAESDPSADHPTVDAVVNVNDALPRQNLLSPKSGGFG